MGQQHQLDASKTVLLTHKPALDNDAPLLATFRNGPPAPTKRKPLTFEVYENPVKKQRLVITNTDKIAYQGANFGYLGASNDCANYAVGIYNKATQEVRLCNISQIYVMQQAIKGLDQTQDPSLSSSQNATNKTRLSQRKDLVEAFGSKKSKRVQKSHEENVVNQSNIRGASAVMKSLKQTVHTTQEQLSKQRELDGATSTDSAALAATRNALLPPCNLDASTPSKVYDVKKFIDTKTFDCLEYQAKECIAMWGDTVTVADIIKLSTQSQSDSTNTFNPTVLAQRFLSSLDQPYKKKKLALMVYMSALEQFSTIVRFPLRKSASFLSERQQWPLILTRHLLENFATASRIESEEDNTITSLDEPRVVYTQSKAMKDKAMLHILVIALHLNGFHLDLTEISNDVKKPVTALMKYCKQLGCSPLTPSGSAQSTDVYSSNSMAATKRGNANKGTKICLSLPLQFPIARRGGGARR